MSYQTALPPSPSLKVAPACFSLFKRLLQIILFVPFLVTSIHAQVEFVVKNDVIDCGGEFTVEIAVNNFQDIGGFQFTLDYDQSVLNYLSLNQNISPPVDLNLDPATDNILISWFTSGGISLADGTVIMEVTFDHTGPCEETFIIHIVDDPVSVEAISSSFQLLPYLLFGGVFLPHDFCDLTVDAGEDQFICDPGELVNLSGTIDGDYFDHFWEPENLVTQPDALNTTAEVNATTTFVLTGRKKTQNIVYNTHFDHGYTGFFSDYEYDSDDLSGGNVFTVANSPDAVYTNFPGCSDHTGNNGNMLIVNGSGAPAQNVWCQYIQVEAETTYILEAFTHTLLWPSALFPLPELQFEIDGTPVGGIYSPDDIPCFSDWTKMEGMWTSTSAGTIELCIYNHQGGVNPGNSFILDDIAMIPLCTVEDEMEVELRDPAEEWVEATICPVNGSVVIAGQEYTEASQDVIILERPDQCDSIINVEVFELELEAVIQLPAPITCTNPEINISATGSTTGPDIVYNWATVDGNIVSGQNSDEIVIDQPGTYTLVLHYDDGELECFSEEASVEVMEDLSVPDVDITGPTELNCDIESLVLTAEASPLGPYDYSWETPNGNIVGGNTDELIEADAPGTYTVEITNTDNGCSIADTVIVTEDIEPPVADAGPDGAVNCMDTVILLDGSGSGTGSNFTLSWQSPNGSFSGSPDSAMVQVDAPGMYIIEVVNQANHCTSQDTAFVVDEKIYPNLESLAVPQIDCANDSVWIDINLVNDDLPFGVSWTSADGTILHPSDSLQILVGSGGTYTAVVEFPSTGCATEIDVEVQESLDPPVADAGTDAMLSCINTQIELDGSGSSTGSDFTYLWTTSSGHIVSGENSLQPVVDSQGIYTLEVINNENGCAATDSVEVGLDEVTPEIELAGDSILDCNHTQAEITIQVLNASGFSPEFSWSTQDGNILGDNQLQTIEVDQAGNYTAEVTFSENGCSAQTTFEIAMDALSPVIDSVVFSPISCLDPETQIEVFHSQTGSEVSYEWEGPAGGLPGMPDSNIVFTEVEGVYTFTITNSTNGCQTSESIEIESDTDAPFVTLSVSGVINCLMDEVEITADYQGQSGLEFEWSTADGEINGPSDESAISAGSPGTYQLIATDPENGCSDTTMATVELNVTPPTALAGDHIVWTCADSVLQIDGSGSEQGSHISYQWTAIPGMIYGPDYQPEIEIGGPGVYVLEVTDNDNGCTQTDTLMVTSDEEFPEIQLAQGLELTCDLEEGWIGFDNISGTEVEIHWYAVDGNIVSGTDSLWILVDSPGTYFISVTSLENSCEVQMSTEVQSDTQAPVADAGESAQMGCNTQQVLLDGSNSSQGPEFAFAWSTSNGNINQGEQSNQAMVDQPGIYILEVTNTENGCHSTDTTEVIDILEYPDISINGDTVITCDRAEIELTASVNTSSLTAMSEWTHNGSSLPQNGANQVSIDEAGNYELLVWFEENQCSTTQTIAITKDTVKPVVTIDSVGVLDCVNNSIFLSGQANDTLGIYTFSWTGPEGTIPAPPDELQTNAEVQGTYIFEVTNSENGCRTVDSASVDIDTTKPEFEILYDPVSGCGDLTGELTIHTAENKNYEIIWEGPSGIAVEFFNEKVIEIDSGGWYFAELTDPDNGCSSRKSVFQEWNAHPSPTADAGPDKIFGCGDSIVLLGSSGSTFGAEIAYHWTTPNGTINSGTDSSVIAAGGPGIYILEVTNTEGNCSDADTVEVTPDHDFPAIEIQVEGGLNCAENEVNLDASASEFGPDTEAIWSGTAPFDPTDADGFVISATEAGSFTFQLINHANGCMSSQTIEVEENYDRPEASAGNDLQTGCADTLVSIGAEISADTGNKSYTWTALSGQIMSDPDKDSVLVSPGGVFVLTVLDITNHCTASDTVRIVNQNNFPLVDAGPDKTINCTENAVLLEGNQSDSGPGFEIYWTTENGHIESGKTTLNPVVSGAGTYLLVITDTGNGCSAWDEVEVTLDTSPPEIDAGISSTLNCRDTLHELNGTIYSPVTDFSIQWSTQNGSIVSGESDVNPKIDRPGIYSMAVTNDENGCTASDSVEIFENTIAPSVEISGELHMDCNNPTARIDIDANDGHSFFYTLVDPGGNTIDFNSSSAEVEEAGIYRLQVLDSINFCRTDTLLEITENKEKPDAVIDCMDCDPCDLFPARLTSDGSNSASGQLEFTWDFEQEGVIIDDENIELQNSGRVFLIATDPHNGCVDTTYYDLTESELAMPPVQVSHIDCELAEGRIEFESQDTSLKFSIDGGQNFSGEPNFNSLSEGIYNLQVKYIQHNCATEDQSVEIRDERVDIVIDLPDLIELTEGEFYRMDPTLSPHDVYISSYEWEPEDYFSCTDCPDPVIVEIPESEQISLSVETPGGCTGFSTSRLKVKLPESGLFIPTAFSPNGDDVNDRLVVFASPDIGQIELMEIYNRWGERVFLRKNFRPGEDAHGWDGTFRGEELGPDIFVVVVTYTDERGNLDREVGEVNLLR
jgi:gliding motility-associated-like protein